MYRIHPSIYHTYPTHLAPSAPLWSAVSIPSSPVSLIRHRSVLAYADWLPGFIESLKEEYIHTPVQDAANSLLPEGLRSADAWNSRLVVGTSRPSGLSNPELRSLVRAASHGLDVAKRLHDVVKEAADAVGEFLSLPV